MGSYPHARLQPSVDRHSCCAVSLQSCCQSVQSHIDRHAPAWLKPRSTLSAFRPKTFTPHSLRAMSYTLQNLTPRTGTPSSPFPESVFLQSEQPCGDQLPQQSGALTEISPLTGYELNGIAEDRNCRHFTGDGQFTEHEDLRVRPLSFHRSIKASAYDSAESIATPRDSDFDEQLRALLASPLYQERRASSERSQVCHSEGENLMSSSSQDPTSTGKPVAVFSSQNWLNQDIFR